jgi:hypothetical protein
MHIIAFTPEDNLVCELVEGQHPDQKARIVVEFSDLAEFTGASITKFDPEPGFIVEVRITSPVADRPRSIRRAMPVVTKALRASKRCHSATTAP